MMYENFLHAENTPDLTKFHIANDFKIIKNESAPVNQDIRLAVSNIQNGQATISYKFLPNSKPHSLGYQILVFQGTTIPWTPGTPPAVSFKVPTDNPTGSFVASANGIGIDEYIAIVQTNCAYYDSFAYSATIPKIGDDPVSTYITIDKVEVGVNDVSVKFSTLPGNKPNTYGNGVAIWNSATPSFNGSGVIAYTLAPSDNPNGTASLNVTLNRGTVYCIAYLTARNWGTVAQYVTINT